MSEVITRVVRGVKWVARGTPVNDFELMGRGQTAVWPVEGAALLVRDGRETMVEFFRQCLREGMTVAWDLADWRVWSLLSERVPALIQVVSGGSLLEVNLVDTVEESDVMAIVGVIGNGREELIGKIMGLGGVMAGVGVKYKLRDYE